MRTRSRNHRNVPLSPPRDAPPFPEEPAALRSQPATRRRFPSPSPALSPTSRSDVMLRNVVLLSVAAAAALLFLNLFLYSAIVAVGLLAPAWQTFKALEGRPSRAKVEVEEVYDFEDTDSVDDIFDPDYIPSEGPSASRRSRPRVEVQPSADDTLRTWQAYWVLSALLFAADAMVLSPFVKPLLPRSVHLAALFSAVTWLTRNKGGNARAVYIAAVRPAFLRVESAIDSVVDRVVEEADRVTRLAVLQLNQTVAPYAKQLEHAASETARQLHGQAHGRLGREMRGRFLRRN